ncbi:carbohydrate kinase [Rheinheimera sp.]|uniref:carbohydrate kinase family protein n=1 Tax=Rheinheimera sp. TaxID=1869214 RepID=UPI00307DB57C
MPTVPVCCFGEALIDFLQDPAQPDLFRRYAGGAPANVAVAVARLGGQSHFLGMLGQDLFGDFLHQQLVSYGVNCELVRFTSDAKTALAFVALNQDGDRSFSFYRPPSADLLYRAEHCPAAFWQQPGILHLCSNSLTMPDIAATSFSLIQQARQHGWLISVDANLRHNLWACGQADRVLVRQLVQQADLVKLGEDELRYLADEQTDTDWIRQLLAGQARWVLVTAGAAEVGSYSRAGHFVQQVTAVQVKDSTAAGDAFVGAWLYQLAHRIEQGQSLDSALQSLSWQQQLVQGAIKAGSFTCMSYGAFAALPDRQQWLAAQNG